MVVALVECQRNRYQDAFAANPLATLKALMQENEMTQADLSSLLGVTRSTASQIFNGQRGISKKVAITLAERFKMNAGAFLAKSGALRRSLQCRSSGGGSRRIAVIRYPKA